MEYLSTDKKLSMKVLVEKIQAVLFEWRKPCLLAFSVTSVISFMQLVLHKTFFRSKNLIGVYGPVITVFHRIAPLI